ncbi:MAG: hypothetical protein MUF21_14275, partial [Gemmatimonadaceae bacterium]|nr:hypothetical protein [Gemmatimonadaceae bacterium]
MPTLDERRLLDLLPTIHRLRDAESGGALQALVAVMAREIAVVQEGIDQGYDDLFIETCADWVVPYIGDLLGTTLLRPIPGLGSGARAEVANTLALRRRKGTLAVVEEIARDITQWPAVAVECFQRLATTQHMRHVRAAPPATLDLRDRRALELVDTAFDRSAHVVEVRRIASARGRWNIPNIAIVLHRLRAVPMVDVTAARIDDFRCTFDPLGIDQPLYTLPDEERAITDLAQPIHVPIPITRLAMRDDLDAYYGPGRSIAVTINDVRVDAADVRVCDLSDAGAGAWAHAPVDHVAIDPVLGRLALPSGAPAPAPGTVLVTYHVGAADTIGGGGYARTVAPFAAPPAVVEDGAGLAAAFANFGAVPRILVADARSYTVPAAAPNLAIAAGVRAVVAAADGARPLITITGGDFVIEGDEGAVLELEGLCLAGATVRVRGPLARLVIRHCTLVPGLARTRTNEPVAPDAPSLIVESPLVEVEIDASILGGIRAVRGARVQVTHSIIDATARRRVAYGAVADPLRAGGDLALEAVTVIGTIHAARLDASNAMLVAERDAPGAPVEAAQRQEGCVRYSWLPRTSRVASPFRCLPDDARPGVRPEFTTLRFGVPGQAQLAPHAPRAIRDGGED